MILLRHATRSAVGVSDNSLNSMGEAQAQKLVKHLVPQGPLLVPTKLLASPKIRARETLDPLARAIHVPLKIDDRLDERNNGESREQFEERIVSLLEELTEESARDPKSCALLCTHLDWLEHAMVLMPSDMTDLETSAGWVTAEYRAFEINEGVWSLTTEGAVAP